MAAPRTFTSLLELQCFLLDTLVEAGFDTVLVEVCDDEDEYEDRRVHRPKTAKPTTQWAPRPPLTHGTRPKTAGIVPRRRRPLWKV